MLKRYCPKFIALPIRLQLLALIVLLMLPLSALIVRSAIEARQTAIEVALESIRDVAEGIVGEKQQLAAASQQLASAISQLPGVQRRDPASVQPVLQRILRINSQYANLAIADRSGRYWVSAHPMAAPSFVGDRRFFVNAARTRQFSSGEYAVCRILKRPTIGFGYPLLDDRGRFEGVIVIVVDLDRFRHIPRRVSLPKGAGVTLVDHQGIILARSVDNERYRGRSLPPELFQRIKESPDGSSLRSVGADGVERFAYHRKVTLEGENAPYLYIRAGIPVDAVLGQWQREFARFAGVLAVVVGAGFALAWLIGKRSLVDPISSLETAAREVAKGNLRIRVADGISGGELGSLARAFDTMAAQVAEREEGMAAARDALEKKERELLASRDMLQEWSHRLETAREAERRHIAREFHDVMGQALTALKLDISWLVQRLAHSPESARRAGEMMALTDTLLEKVQSLVAELSPPLLEMGLAEAIEWHAKGVERRSGISCLMMLDETTSRSLTRQEQTVAFRIFQEAITNVVRHSGASEVSISLCSTASAVVLEVADNGCGITEAALAAPTAFGLLGMRERAGICRGTLSVTGTPGQGTVVRLQVPSDGNKGADDEEDSGRR
ncbi:sensor histidine kinase [Geomesophilobacter sediminis]|uniref:histidine kinase n=1 Tax=Geomesophilobacter sediminis TaxID=2798584 RepID=A0A8J7IXF5_9BACT|nr:cache domain-containing protein [Geomesophilobacter sediminis]MBJ6724562.1 HAMP domain-containing protein [Geomesophilobacter sediminis]